MSKLKAGDVVTFAGYICLFRVVARWEDCKEVVDYTYGKAIETRPNDTFPQPDDYVLLQYVEGSGKLMSTYPPVGIDFFDFSTTETAVLPECVTPHGVYGWHDEKHCKKIDPRPQVVRGALREDLLK